MFRLGDRVVDTTAARVTRQGSASALTAIEARLLAYLAQRNGRVVPRDELLVEVWGYRAGVRTRTIDNTSSRLRKKIEDDPNTPRYLVSLYGQGLRLDGAESAERSVGHALTRFVGRGPVLASVEAAFHEGRRLVTLWGPGGAGKTRVMNEVVPRLGFDAAVVDCGAIHQNPDPVVAAALGLGPSQRLSLDRFGRILLVLDECEQALDAVRGRIERWLADAPALRILATSRIALDLPGERRIAVGPLDEDEARELFLDRARGHDPRFDAPPDDLTPVVATVDRLPLAIELMAARVHLLGLGRVRETLDPSLAAVVERSFGLLAADDLRILRCAAWFEAPFDLRDLEQVADLDPASALRGVESLVAQSLLRVHDEGGERRFAPYAVVRDRARRVPAPDRDEVSLRYVRWFARLGELATVFACRSDASLQARFQRSQPDLRRALALALELPLADGPELAAACGLAVVSWALEQGPAEEADEIFDRLAEVPVGAAARAALGVQDVRRWYAVGQLDRAVEAVRATSALATDPDTLVWLQVLAAELARQVGDEPGVGRALVEASRAAPRARYTEALWRYALAEGEPDPGAKEAGYRLAAEVARRTRDHRTEALIHVGLARCAVAREDWAAGRRAFLRGARVNEQIGLQSMSLLLLWGHTELMYGDLDEAERLLGDAIAACTARGRSYEASLSRIGLGCVWCLRGWYDDAIALVEPIADGTAQYRAGGATVVLAEV
ncbi:MAG: winged helix-turn-helix domain-containing protein, partial [Myxococcota bacterium]